MTPRSHFLFYAGIPRGNGIEINRDGGNYLRFLSWRNGVEANISYGVGNWEMDSWHHVQCEWGQEGLFLYIDAELVGTEDLAGAYAPPLVFERPIAIGCNPYHTDKVSDCVIDKVRVCGPDTDPPIEPTLTPTNTATQTSTHTPTNTPTSTPTPYPDIVVEAYIEPEIPRTNDDLECIVTIDDPMNRPGFYFNYRWFRNGDELVDPMDVGGEILCVTNSILSRHFTTKNETYYCNVEYTNDFDSYDTDTDSVKIHNSPPSAPVVEILPKNPSPGQDLGAEIVVYSVDPDGDQVDYRFDWYKSLDGGETWIHKIEFTDIPFVSHIYLFQGELWRVEVTPFEVPDGNSLTLAGQDGESGWDLVYVGDNERPVVTIDLPGSLDVVADPSIDIAWHAEDANGDDLTVDLYYDADGVKGGAILIAEGLSASGSIKWTPPVSKTVGDNIDLTGDGRISHRDVFALAGLWEKNSAVGGYRIFARAWDDKGAMGESFSDGCVIVEGDLPAGRSRLIGILEQWPARP